MSLDSRKNIIQERLQQKFSPHHLEVINDSQQHIGHAGSQNGAGHYTVIISSDHFKNKSRVVIHREIYDVLQDLIPQEIHALRIKIL